jgi:hypothetical protein
MTVLWLTTDFNFHPPCGNYIVLNIISFSQRELPGKSVMITSFNIT